MNSENKISIPVILYGVLFVIGVHSFGLVLSKLSQIFLRFILDFENLPFVRFIVLFFEIIFIAKFLKNQLGKLVRRKSLFNMLVLSLLGLSSWFIAKNYYEVPPFVGCAFSIFDGTYESIYENYNKNKNMVDLIEIFVIVLTIFIYTIFRISEMPKESNEIK